MSETLKNISTPPDLAKYWVQIAEGEYLISAPFDGPPTALDIGGCIGVYSRWLRERVYPDCFIHIYEPNPRAHRLLEKNISFLPPDSYALSKTAVLGSKDIETGEPRPATIRLHQGRNNLGEASIYLETGALVDDFVDVPVTFAKDLPQVDILKADCEGPEREILAEYLDTHEPPAVIAVEFHSAGESVRLQKLLMGHGYRLIKATEYEINRGVIVWRHEPGLG